MAWTGGWHKQFVFASGTLGVESPYLKIEDGSHRLVTQTVSCVRERRPSFLKILDSWVSATMLTPSPAEVILSGMVAFS